MKHDSDILKQIKNYFMRRRSAAEAYEYEREIERDAFLYEAIEGMEEMHMSDLQQALDELEERVNKKATATLFDKFNWRFAAMIAVIVVAGSSAVFLGLNLKNQPSVASEEEAHENKEYAPRTNEIDFTDISDSINLIDSYIAIEETSETIEAANAEIVAVQENEVSEKVPLPTENEKPEAQRDKEVQKLKFKDLDSAKSEAKKNTNDVALADEMVVENANASYNWTKVQEADVAVAAESNTRYSAPSTNTLASGKSATPSNGSSAYQQYIASNLKKTDDMKSGSVTVSFEFDKNGHPKKVSVVKSLCEACDQEAIRLIENGPAWNVEDKKERVNYTITIP